MYLFQRKGLGGGGEGGRVIDGIPESSNTQRKLNIQ